VEPVLHPSSIAALKANFFYSNVVAEKAFHAHKAALIRQAECQTALNNALTQKYFRGGNVDETGH